MLNKTQQPEPPKSVADSMFITPQYDKSSKKQDYMDMQDDLLQNIIEKRRKKEQEKVDNLHFHKQ